MILKIAVEPTIEPLSLADAVTHLRVDSNYEDTLIVSMIKSARDYCESYQNRAYITQTWDLVLSGFPSENEITIPRPPLQSVTSIKYYDTADVEATMSTADYMLDTYSEPGRIVLKYGKTWPTTSLRPASGIIIRFIAGYGSAASLVPGRIVQAIKLLVGHMYEHRESTDIKETIELPFTVHSLLGLDRIYPI